MKYNIKEQESYSFATIETPNEPTVSAKISVDFHEVSTVKRQAVQTMYADALLSGSGDQSREVFLAAVNELGASIGVSIGNGTLNISLKSRTANFAKLVKLVDQMFREPTFNKKELTRIKSTTINEQLQSKEDSKTVALSGLLNTIYGQEDRNYTFDIDEVIAEIRKITSNDLKSLHKLVISQKWICTMAGDLKSCKILEKLVQRQKGKSLPKQIVAIHQQKTPRAVAVLKQIPTRSNIDFSIGAPLPITLHHPDYIPLSFGLHVLGCASLTSRLMSTVREKEGLTYGIYARLEGFTGTEQGYWRIITFFAPDKAVQALNSTIRETTKLFSRGISSKELDRFKTTIYTKQTLLNDSIGGLLSELHVYHCHGFSLNEMKEHKARIETLTLEEVNNAIKTYLDPALLTISGAGPVKVVEKEIKKLRDCV